MTNSNGREGEAYILNKLRNSLEASHPEIFKNDLVKDKCDAFERNEYGMLAKEMQFEETKDKKDQMMAEITSDVFNGKYRDDTDLNLAILSGEYDRSER